MKKARATGGQTGDETLAGPTRAVTPEPPAPAPPARNWLIPAIGAAVVVVGVGGYLMFSSRGSAGPPATASAPAAVPAPATAPPPQVRARRRRAAGAATTAAAPRHRPPNQPHRCRCRRRRHRFAGATTESRREAAGARRAAAAASGRDGQRDAERQLPVRGTGRSPVDLRRGHVPPTQAAGRQGAADPRGAIFPEPDRAGRGLGEPAVRVRRARARQARRPQRAGNVRRRDRGTRSWGTRRSSSGNRGGLVQDRSGVRKRDRQEPLRDGPRRTTYVVAMR